MNGKEIRTNGKYRFITCARMDERKGNRRNGRKGRREGREAFPLSPLPASVSVPPFRRSSCFVPVPSFAFPFDQEGRNRFRFRPCFVRPLAVRSCYVSVSVLTRQGRKGASRNVHRPPPAKVRPRGEGETKRNDTGRGGRGGGPSPFRSLMRHWGGLYVPSLLCHLTVQGGGYLVPTWFLLSFFFRPAYSSVFLV